ncbi:MAG: hypothetical protein EP329_14215 [Deltaproteobacteria bacterium]|nr:MAG: hypothetical protein EP329_14215 [Deltaproteobacteria bacterium]
MSIAHAPARPAPRRRRRRRLLGKLAAMSQLVRHLAGSGRWWLVPMVVILVLSAVLVAVVHLVEVAAPFVYSLF